MELVKAKKSDLPMLAEVFRASFKTIGKNWSRETAEKKLAVVLKRDPASCFFGQEENRVVGLWFGNRFWSENGCGLEVVYFAMLPELQGKGLGSKMLNSVEAWAVKNGIHLLRLATDVNEPAFQFYLRNGFEQTSLVRLEKKL